MAAPQFNFTDTGPEELQKLLKKLEFENEQQLVLIDKENQHIEALDSDIKFKYDDIQRLRESTTQLDDETKRVYRQFKQNRTNFESMKKTQLVQQEHEEAMKKKMEFQIVKWQQEKSEYDVLLTQYETTWQTYLEKYESRSLAKELRGIEKLWNEMKEKSEISQQKVVDLKAEIEKLKTMKEQSKPFESITAWIVSVAEISKEILNADHEINVKLQNIHNYRDKCSTLKQQHQQIEQVYEMEQAELRKKQTENARTMTKPTIAEQSEIEYISVEEQGYNKEGRNNTIQELQQSQNSEVNQVVRSSAPTINIPQIHTPESCVSKQPVVRGSTTQVHSTQHYIQRPTPTGSPKHMITIPQLHMPSIGNRSPQLVVPSTQQHVQRPQSTQLLKHIQHQQIQRKLEVAQMNQQQGRTQLELNQQKISDQTQPRDEVYPDMHQESGMIVNTQTETQSSVNTASQYHQEMREFPKTPEHATSSSANTTSTSSTSSPAGSGGSPYTIDKFTNKFRKSPGFQYGSRSMFAVNQTPTSPQDQTDNNPGCIESPFFQSFLGGGLAGAPTSNTEPRDNRYQSQFSNISDSTSTSQHISSDGRSQSATDMFSSSNSESSNIGNLFGQSQQQPSHTSSSTGGFSMFGFNNSEEDERSTGFSFNFGGGGGGGNSPDNSSGGFSLFR